MPKKTKQTHLAAEPVETKELTRGDLISSVIAYHGNAIKRAIIETWSDERLLAYTHPWDTQRPGRGW